MGAEMAFARAFAVQVPEDNPTDGASDGTKLVSDFITVGSLTNFTAMTGAIATAWGGLGMLSSKFDGKWVPFALCMLFAAISVGSSTPGAKFKQWGPAVFVAFVNALTLFGAVLSAATAAAAANG